MSQVQYIQLLLILTFFRMSMVSSSCSLSVHRNNNDSGQKFHIKTPENEYLTGKEIGRLPSYHPAKILKI